MKYRTLLISIGLLLLHGGTYAQTDTLRISDSYTTHLIFSSDIVYADLSSPADVAAKIRRCRLQSMLMPIRITGSIMPLAA